MTCSAIAVYCLGEDSLGNDGLFSDAVAKKVTTTTLCCRSISLKNAPAFVYGSLSAYVGASSTQFTFSFALDYPPEDSLLVTPTIFLQASPSTMATNISSTPTSFTFGGSSGASTGSSSSQLSGSFLVSGVGGNYIVVLQLSGPSSGLYQKR